MNVVELLKYLGTTTVIVGAAAWLAKTIVGLIIAKRTELYKADRTREIETHKADLTRQLESYKVDLTRDLEGHKSKLQHQNNEALEHIRNASAIQMEKLRAELRPIAYAGEVRAAELLKRRADVIAEVYSRLAIAQDTFREYMKMVQRSNEKPMEDRAKAAGDAGQRLIEYYDQHKVFLPADVCELMDDMVKRLTDAWIGYTFWGYGWPTGDSPYDEIKYKGQKEAWEAIKSDVPVARARLERDLRALLGDPPAKE